MNLLACVTVGWACAALASQAFGLRLPLPIYGRRRGRSARGNADVWSWLAEAGLTVSPTQFLAASVFVTLIAFVVLTMTSGAVVAVVPALAAGLAPFSYYSKVRRRRLAQAQREWPDVLRDLLTCVASGQTLHSGLVTLGDRGDRGLRGAFARYHALSRSMGVAPALEVIRGELADPVSDRVIEVLIIASERGGGAVRIILEDLAASITADLRVLDEVDTEVLESRINARAVVVLPWVALVMLNQGGGPFREFYTTSAGVAVVLIGAVLTFIGSVIIARLSRLPVEARVVHSPVKS